MGGAGGPSGNEFVIYDRGSWKVGYDNTPRPWGGYASNPFDIGNDKLYNTLGTACISTANTVDLSRYTTLHVLIERTIANNYSDGICISATKSVNNQVANVIFANLVANTPVEVTLDITSLSSGYIVLHCDTVGWSAYKIWLT